MGVMYNDELNDLYCLPNIIRVVKSGRIRLARHVELIGKTRGNTGFWLGSLRKKDHLEDPGVDKRIILR